MTSPAIAIEVHRKPRDRDPTPLAILGCAVTGMEQPPATIGWPEGKLAKIVTQDAMIGTSHREKVAG